MDAKFILFRHKIVERNSKYIQIKTNKSHVIVVRATIDGEEYSTDAVEVDPCELKIAYEILRKDIIRLHSQMLSRKPHQ